MMAKPPIRASYLFQFDYLLVVFVLAATALGLLVIDGSTHDVAGLSSVARRQALWWGISLAVFAAAVLPPYRWLRVLGWPLYFLSIAVLLWLQYKGGVTAKGATSWFSMSLGSLSFRVQPSEFTKIATVTAIAAWLAWRRDRLRWLHESLPPLLLAAIPMIIICKQPDFGTASVFLPIPFVLLFVAGLPWRTVVIAVVLGSFAGLAGVVYLSTAETVPGLRKYQLTRIRVFLGPITQPFKPPGVEEILYGGDGSGGESGGAERVRRRVASADDWNIRQAEMALGSGRVFGKGWRKGTQARLRFLPEHHTDFIFSSLGEQFGLAGCLALLGLYLLILWRCVVIAAAAADPFGKYLVVGLLSVVLIHVFINVGMSIRLLPVTGLPLPLISYGGSFLATNYLIFGLIANVSMRGPTADDGERTRD